MIRALAILALLTITVRSVDFVTPGQWLESLPKPLFKPGHTLPPLTRTGYCVKYSTNMVLELVRNWGYAWDLDVFNLSFSQLTNNSHAQFAFSVITNNPQYKLSVMWNNGFPTLPDSAYCSTNGFWIDVSGNLWHTGDIPSYRRVRSPETPNELLNDLAAYQLNAISNVNNICPVSVILNSEGSEVGLPFYTGYEIAFGNDPIVTQAQQESGLNWHRYALSRKQVEQYAIYNVATNYFPDRSLFVYYTMNGFGSLGESWEDMNDPSYMSNVADIVSLAMYFFPNDRDLIRDASLGGYDLLTRELAGYVYWSQRGYSNFYHWTQGGWMTNRSDRADAATWTGFIKCSYMAGMVGANAGYYVDPSGEHLAEIHTSDDDYSGGANGVFPPDKPPGFVEQYATLGYVHALFSWLEDFLRNASLLSGPQTHFMRSDYLAYEFTNYQAYANCRTLVRKHNDRDEWLICAWASDSTNRDITITVPTLGEINLRSADTGNVYRATVATGPRLVNNRGEIARSQVQNLRANTIRGR